MSVLWVIEDSPGQLHLMQSLLTKIGLTVYAFQDPSELLEHISELAFPEAVIVNLSLKGITNGFQAAKAIRAQRPEIATGRFCFTSGWRKHWIPVAPEEFRDNVILDKDSWRLEELLAALHHAINSQGGVS